MVWLQSLTSGQHNTALNRATHVTTTGDSEDLRRVSAATEVAMKSGCPSGTFVPRGPF